MRQYKTSTGLAKVGRKIFYGKYANWPKTFWFNCFLRSKTLKRIKEKAKRGEQLKVVFFVLNISMWKYESLFKLLRKDMRFDPVIIPYPLLWQSPTLLKANEKGIIDYCKENGFKYKVCYDIDNMEYISAENIGADFVSYSQPYNNCPDFWKVEKFYRNTLVFNYPYGLPIDNNPHFCNLLTENVAWRLFHTTDTSRETYLRNPITKGRNFLWVGSTIYDKLRDRNANVSIWKQPDSSLERIIWAPHHTIGENDDLPFSTFLQVADEMLNIANEYRGKVQFVFKPHPMLRERLESIWGKEKTDRYYTQWNEMENTTCCTGDYADLFLSSDALIHDCAGFTMEYLFTKKPVMFLLKKNDIRQYVSSFSYSCFQHHYKGRTGDDIRKFIDAVVIDGNDTMKTDRDDFYNKHLLPPNGKSAAENMYNEFISVFK